MIRTVTGRLPGEKPPKVSGTICIPASKSHTIRALLIAAFAEGESILRRPLVSRDSISCRGAVEALGAVVTDDGPDWVVQGFGSRPKPLQSPGMLSNDSEALSPPGMPSNTTEALPGSPAISQSPAQPSPININVGNSGTTLYLAAALAALSDSPVRFDGDQQIRRRSAAPLLDALKAMGAQVESAEGGCAPFTVRGPLKAGTVTVDCPVSQYLSALLLAAPLIPAGGAASNLGRPASFGGGASDSYSALPPENADTGLNPQREKHIHDTAAEVSKTRQTTIKVNTLNEAPYVGITLDWLDGAGIQYERDGWDEFRVPGGQSYRAFDKVVPADWSSATFFLVAAAITGGSLTLEGLDYGDSQGDKAVLDMLGEMGCKTEVGEAWVKITGRPMKGAVLDLNATPDALPAMAVAACFAEGETRLVNVPQARQKETDRIAVMTSELLKLGADVEELPDGMIIRGRLPGAFKGALVEGHDDHRVVMALAVAALGGCGELGIKGAEAADVTFPGFFELLEKHLSH